jgi:DNA-binding MarR family transcriptional regulator
MSNSALTDFNRAGDNWGSFSSPAAEVREFFLHIARSIVHLWKKREFNTLEKHLRELAHFADRVPELSSDELIRAYARGAIDILLEQGTELLDSSSSSTERLISSYPDFGKNHVRVIASLYERPLRPIAISKEAGLDPAYTNRILKDLERSEIVQRVGQGYGLTPAGVNACARIVEPGWAHKARRFFVVMLESLDRIGTFSRRALCQKVSEELIVSSEVAEHLVTRSLSELEVKGRLLICQDLVTLKGSPFATAEAVEEIHARITSLPQQRRPTPIRPKARALAEQ